MLKKGNRKDLVDRKEKGWLAVRDKLFAVTGMRYEKEKLKKWSNIQSRVKENSRKRKATGGGDSIPLTKNDDAALDIMGEQNPVVNKCPGAMDNHSEVTPPKHEEATTNSKSCKIKFNLNQLNHVKFSLFADCLKQLCTCSS